jgi:T5SS/PEP-CTERM-associated repeat protein
MTTTISANFPNGLDLTDPTLNPIVITGTIGIGTSSNFAAVQGETVAAWDVTNQGIIAGGTGATGIDLLAGGAITNAATASISGFFGAVIQGISGAVVNAGSISAGTGGAGVFLTHGGTVSNLSGGQIQSGGDGIAVQNSTGIVTNAGTVNASATSAGIDLLAGGTVTNVAGGLLTGDWGISIQGATTGSVANAGIITGGSQSGVFLSGGTVVNRAGGQISGNWGVADVSAAGTVISSGTIIGTNGTAVTLPSGFANLVVNNPGAAFSGLVDGGNTIGAAVVSTLELGASPLQGTLSGLGVQFLDFGQTVVDPGASWALTGSNTVVAGATLVDQGRVVVNASTLAGPGSVTIASTAGIFASATITGSGAVSGVSALTVGDAGTGSLLVSNQATASAINAVLGASAGGTGETEVSGPGSRFVANGSLTVGGAGAGRLNVTSQGTVQSGSLAGGGTDISQLAGAAGEISVTGSNSFLTNVGTFIVGDAGVGRLAIQSGGSVITTLGSVSSAPAAVIAGSGSASGSSVGVSGAGSNWQITGSLIVGNGGQGLLNVSQGAVVTAASADLAAGVTGDGVISVAGTGSALTLTGSLTVGDQAAGELSVLNGATVSALDVTIGNTSSLSSGNVDVEGAGSRLLIGAGGSLNIGVAGGGSGVLTVGPGATLTFGGTIVESGHASFNNNGGVVDPDAVEFTTTSNGGTGLNEYDLFVGNIGAVQVSAGTGTWLTPMVLTGTSAADADNNINNNGDTGQWQLSQSGTFIVNANTIDAGQAIVFEDATDTLVIGQVVNGGSAGVSGQVPTIAPGAMNLLQAGGFDAQIWGYQAGDKIDFNNMIVSSDSIVNGNTLDLFDSSNTLLGSLTFFNKAGNKPLALAGMQAAAAQIACFAEGTMIETVTGPRRVESLAVGDEVVTLLGGPGRIVWIGSRRVDCARHPRPETVWPVCIAAGAFGENVPARDLFVSPDHAVFVNAVLVPVKLLVNGTSITQVKQDRVRYFHVELPRHAVILAEGLTVESYLDLGDRANFHPDGATVRLFPEFTAKLATETALVWETRGAAKLVMAGHELVAARRAVMKNAKEGHSRSSAETARAG